MHDLEVPVGYFKKLRAQWVGPYRVCNVGSNLTYLRHAETNDTGLIYQCHEVKISFH